MTVSERGKRTMPTSSTTKTIHDGRVHYHFMTHIWVWTN